MTIARIDHPNQQEINTTSLQESSRSMNRERSVNQTVKNVDRETLINRGFDVYRAVTKNNFYDFLHHLNKGPILEEARGLAVITAAFKNNREFVEILLCNGSISTKDREWAIVKAGENSNFELVGLLLRSGDISEWGRASPW